MNDPTPIVQEERENITVTHFSKDMDSGRVERKTFLERSISPIATNSSVGDNVADTESPLPKSPVSLVQNPFLDCSSINLGPILSSTNPFLSPTFTKTMKFQAEVKPIIREEVSFWQITVVMDDGDYFVDLFL